LLSIGVDGGRKQPTAHGHVARATAGVASRCALGACALWCIQDVQFLLLITMLLATAIELIVMRLATRRVRGGADRRSRPGLARLSYSGRKM
jgi:hypothetical protein